MNSQVAMMSDDANKVMMEWQEIADACMDEFMQGSAEDDESVSEEVGGALAWRMSKAVNEEEVSVSSPMAGDGAAKGAKKKKVVLPAKIHESVLKTLTLPQLNYLKKAVTAAIGGLRMTLGRVKKTTSVGVEKALTNIHNELYKLSKETRDPEMVEVYQKYMTEVGRKMSVRTALEAMYMQRTSELALIKEYIKAKDVVVEDDSIEEMLRAFSKQ